VGVADANEPAFLLRYIDDFEWLCCKFVWYWSNFRDSGVW